MNSTIGIYVKDLATLVVTGLTAYIAAVTDGDVTSIEWITIVISVLVASGIVWAIPSTPKWFQSYGKAFASALTAGLSSIAVGLLDAGLSQAEIVTAVVAFITALGLVAASPNAAASDPVGADGRIVPVTYQAKQNLIGTPPPPVTPTTT